MTDSRLGAAGNPAASESRNRSTNRRLRSHRTTRRQLLGTAATGTLGTSLAGCLDIVGGTEEETGEIKVGVLAGGTGASQTVAAEVAAAEINADGGLLGRDVTVATQETDKSPLEARRSYHRLVLQENVDVTMGISTTEVLEHRLDDFAEQELLHFTTGSGTLTPPKRIQADYEKYKYHFRTGPINNTQLVENQFAFIGDMFPQLGWESMGVLTEGYPWTDEIIPTFERTLPRFGIDVPYSYQYPPAIDDFTSIYDDIEAADVDALWVGMGHTGNTAIAQWARQRRSFEFGGTHVGMQTPDYYDLLGGAPRYGFTQTAATPTSELTPYTQRFAEQYRARTGGDEPIYTSYHMYDSFRAYATAVERAGTLDTDAVIPELEAIEIDGTTGTIDYYDRNSEYPHDRVYDPNDDNHSGSVFFQWQENDNGEGVQQIIWPERFATAEYEKPPWV